MCAEIKRRLKRFYRKIDGDKIVYSKKSSKDIKKEIKNVESKINKSKTDNYNENFEIKHKKIIIDKILNEMETNIHPDIDTISEMIYSQFKKNNINIDHNTVNKVVRESNHFRASKSSKDQNTTNLNLKNNVDIREKKIDEREKLIQIIDNVYDQIKKNKILEKYKKEKKSVSKLGLDEDISKSKSKKEESKVEISKKENENEKPKLKEEKSNSLNLNFDTEDDDLDNKDDLSDDDLGLKF